MKAATVLVEESLAAIDQHATRINAFIHVDAEGARAAAYELDEERRRGINRGPLHGLPISIKDLIDVAGQPTTAASHVRRDHVALQDAIVVQRLRAAGLVLIGKTNLHEFALGTTSDESAFGAVHNPHDTSRSAGGSSGGSAAAVAAGMGLASIGSDTGGSIRIPAAACGIVGLKPSRRDVPLQGVVPMSTTFDHVGPLTRSVTDAAHLWAVLAHQPAPDLDSAPASALTLGALGGYFTEFLSDEVQTAFSAALDDLRAAGVHVEERTVASAASIVDTYGNISLAEAAHWHAATLATQPGDYQAGVRERLERGSRIPAVHYLRARAARRQLRHAVDQSLHGCNALVLPTLPIVAPLLGATMTDIGAADEPLTVRLAMLRLTQLFNVTGHPAISLPVRVAGLPVGLQLVGRLDNTPDLLAVARACERVLRCAQHP